VLAPPRSATVLVVEDDPAIRELYRAALVAARYDVVIATDGLSALTLIDREVPDVVVLDLGLPRVSGWDVYRDLRARPETQALPVIIATGSEPRDIREQDVAAFLRKPVDPDALARAVDRVIAHTTRRQLS
jgi:two-component system phosphate regulon response regulator PhoB